MREKNPTALLLFCTINPTVNSTHSEPDVGGMQALSKNMQNYSFVSSNSNRQTEPSLLPKHVGVETPGELG